MRDIIVIWYQLSGNIMCFYKDALFYGLYAYRALHQNRGASKKIIKLRRKYLQSVSIF